MAARRASSEKVPAGPRNAMRIATAPPSVWRPVGHRPARLATQVSGRLAEGDLVARAVVARDLLARNGVNGHLQRQLLTGVGGRLDRDRGGLDVAGGDPRDGPIAGDRLGAADPGRSEE